MRPKNYYEILGIPRDASQDAIKQAYRKLALKYHPDKNKGDKASEHTMKELNFIYSILSVPEKRHNYDRTIEEDARLNWEARLGSFCDEREVIDSTGAKVVIRVGQNVYYPVEIDKSIITWKYQKKEYFNVYVKNIIRPERKANVFTDLKHGSSKTPLCVAYFGKQDLIIYEEDFRAAWLSEESYKKIDLKRGLIAALLLFAVICIGVFYLFITHPISAERRETLEREMFPSETDPSRKRLLEHKQFLREEYKATDGEINYILTEKYATCSKSVSKIIDAAELSTAPTIYGFVKATLPKNSEVVLLLYAKDSDAYKVESGKVSGWLQARLLDKPVCEEDEPSE